MKLARAGGQKQIVALLDEQTSGVDAHKLARAIKHSGVNPKVIMFSAQGGARDSTAAVDLWITKPVRPSHLFSCLLELFGNTDRGRVEKIAAPQPGSAGDQPPQWRKTVRVLLVDDNLVNRTVGAKQLTTLGYAAQIVDCASRGLEIVSSGGCDIVLMDCEMPEMDGYEAVAEIRRREGDSRHSLVIALTAHATADDRARCLNSGMDDYLSKPVKLQALGEMLDTWARGKLNNIITSQQ
jgi:CheY-like chemotaxis protein